ncbi:HAD family hydrolase [Novacetimonas pomaceti]|uniref:HAD family hydrolase n=1 Tax=Novacetimonas pomaceti TaxID=2021998 RepID=A0A318QQ13_9PROT|nr:HAD family phosphatase [Novacetimonas pomaceti]PYD74813.1 HAD family hydrolase [Novacetimonas pomaceti]
MIEAVIFDMDGVLIDAKEWHYEAFNRALRLFGKEISLTDHLSRFDGLPTKRKLQILSLTENFPVALHGFASKLKQIYTMEIVNTQCKPVFTQERALSYLKREGYKMGVASNSIRASVEVMMQRSNLAPYLDLMMSNEDVKNAKPSPEIYIKSMESLKVKPENTLIVEDNENGIKAARASGAHVLVVASVNEVNYENITSTIKNIEKKQA